MIEELQSAKMRKPASAPRPPAPAQSPAGPGRAPLKPEATAAVPQASRVAPTIPTATGVSFDQAIGPIGAVVALPIDAAMPVTGWRAWLQWRPGPATEPMKPLAVWACVALGLALAISMLQWPYARSCGWWLLLYFTAVAMVIVAGVWSAWHAWDSRVGVAHVVAIAIVFWGCALTAREVLPRVGYARVSNVWTCSGRA